MYIPSPNYLFTLRVFFLARYLVINICLLIECLENQRVSTGHVAGLENIAKTGYEELLIFEMRVSKNITLLKSR